MRQRTKAFKVRSAALLLTGLLAFGCLLPIPVYAGLETGETYSNSFDFGALDGAWVSECAQVETDEGQEPGLRFAGASEAPASSRRRRSPPEKSVWRWTWTGSTFQVGAGWAF